MPFKDRAIIAMLVFFIAVAFTLELYWLLHPRDLPAHAGSNVMAHLFQIYGDSDRAYFDAINPFTISLEGINVYFTQALNVALIYAIWKRRPYRHGLQLLVGSYISYSVILYFLSAHLSGYENMRYRSGYTYFLFYATNLPWLLAHLYLAGDSMVAVNRRFAAE
jgi:hypothetical protein